MSRDDANRIAAAKVIADQLRKLDRQARADLADYMEPGDSIAAVLGGVKLGKVSMREGSLTARVTNPDALLAHVKATRPDEIRTTESVSEFHLKNLLDDAKAGEIVPGIELTHSTPTLALTGVPKDALAVVMDAVRSGAVRLEIES